MQFQDKTIFFFLFFVVSCNTTPQMFNEAVPEIGTLESKENLKGKVKSVIDSAYFTGDNTELSIRGQHGRKIEFDTAGKITSTSAWINKKTISADSSDISYQVDDMGKFEFDRITDRDIDLGIKLNDIRIFDEGRVVENYATAQNQMLYKKYERNYDKNFNLVEFKKFDTSNTLIGRYTFSYNDKQSILEWDLYNNTGLLFKKIRYNYDDNNNETNYAIYTGNGSLVDQFNFKYSNYDTTGNWLTIHKYKNGKPFAVMQRRIEYFPLP